MCSTTGARPANYDRRDDKELELSDQRRRAITLLADLLQFHSDQDKSDRVSNVLYKELLAVVGQRLLDLLFVGQLRQEVSAALNKLRLGELDLLRIKTVVLRASRGMAGKPAVGIRAHSGQGLCV